MGYSTTIYAVDVDALKSTVGSKDAALLKRFQKSDKSNKARTNREEQGPRIKLTVNSEIILNGQSVTWEEFVQEMRQPKWRGTYIYEYIEDGKIKGRWSKPGSFPMAMGEALAGTRFLGTNCCSSEDDLYTDWDDDDEITVEQAAVELLTGKVTQPDAGHQYTYALEQLCEAVGKHLVTIEGKRGMMNVLQLNTPLSKPRSPIALPERDDFPDVGYLSADEVNLELSRLRGLDLSFPDDEYVDQSRKDFLKALGQAARKGVGVVAFYY